MNNKIKKIAEQAGYNDQIYEISQEGLEKFAELIIRECAKPVNNLFKQGGGTWGEVILKHFDIPMYEKNKND